MSKKFQLLIPTPCNENWDNMTPVEKGRFCGSCQKQVVDFSKMSDREVAMFFKKPSTGSVCGRFMEDQLNRDIEIPKKRIPWIKYFFQFVLPAFLISNKVKAQGKIMIKAELLKESKCTQVVGNAVPGVVIPNLMGMEALKPVKQPDLSRTSISGKVIDEINQVIPFARISIKETEKGTLADGNGQFTIRIDKKTLDPIIIVSAVGYKQVEIPIDDKQYPKDKKIIIVMKFDVIIEKETVTTGCRLRKKIEIEPIILSEKKFNDTTVLPEVIIAALQGRVGLVTAKYVTEAKKDTIFRKIRKVISDSFINSGLKLYPNPVNSGTMLNIEWKQTEEGEYILQLFNQAGQLIFDKAIWIDKDARVLNLEIPHVAAGNYFLRMTNKHSGKTYTEKIIIQ